MAYLNRKYAGIPLWGWAIVTVVILIAFYLYFRRRKSSGSGTATASTAPATSQTDSPLSTIGGTPSSGGSTSTTTGNDGGTVVAPAPPVTSPVTDRGRPTDSIPVPIDQGDSGRNGGTALPPPPDVVSRPIIYSPPDAPVSRDPTGSADLSQDPITALRSTTPPPGERPNPTATSSINSAIGRVI